MRQRRRPPEGSRPPAAAELLEPRTLLTDVVTPLGSEFLVPSDSSRNELLRFNVDAVASDAAGNFVVVWEDFRSNLDQNVVWLRRFSAAGVPLGAAAPVSGGTGGMGPAVAMNSRGDFVVTWMRSVLRATNSFDYDVVAQRFAPDGTPLGGTIPLHDDVSFHQIDNRAAMDEQGGFVATWTKTGHEGSPTFPFSAPGDVYARRFDAAGQPLGPEFRVNDYTDRTQHVPDVAVDAAGNFVIIWNGYGNTASVTYAWAQRFAADGSRRGPNVQLSDDNGGSNPRVAMDADGDYATVFNARSFTNNVDIVVRRFDAQGQSLGDPVFANTGVAVGDPSVIDMAPGGQFVVGWFRGVPGDRNGYGRFFGAAGGPIGPEFRLTDVTSVRYNPPAGIAIADDGNFVAAWTSRPSGDATQDADVYARRFDGPDAPATVVGRHVFYNGSFYDGRILEAHPQDDMAIATDKAALRPGQAASFANVTSYPGGINGIMIDVSGGLPTTALAGLAGNIGLKAGTAPDPATWADAPRPSQIAIRTSAGVNGSDRITLIWPDGSIRNTWLQVTVPALPPYGLASGDVFYYGNLVGEVGNSDTELAVNMVDALAIRRHYFSYSWVGDPFDIDRDYHVTAADFALARRNIGRRLPLIQAPGPAAPAAASILPPPTRIADEIL